MAERTAYVNGEFVPLAEAKVSVLDRGFLFADGVYEVSAVIGRRLVDNDAHLARLERSLGEIAMAMPLPREGIVRAQEELVARDALDEGLVYLQVTRGAAERDFAFPKDAKPTLVMFTQAKSVVVSPYADTGVKVVTVPDLRWARRDIKSVALLAQVLAKQAAAEAGAYEAWMTEDDGTVTEGSSSTAYIVSADGVIVARPNSRAILPGITRASVLRLAAERGTRIEERGFTVAEAKAAAEAMMTSASSLVLPVVSIDGDPVGDGRPGPVARRLRAIYLDMARAAPADARAA